MQYFQTPFEQEDAVQEAFTHLYAHLDAVDPLRVESLPGWVVTSARNKILDLARQKRPAAQLELTDDLVGEEEGKGLEVVVSAELRAVMGHFEEKLKPAYRPYFRAVFVEGRLKLDQWDDKDGQKRTRLKVVAESVQFLDSSGKSAAATTPAPTEGVGADGAAPAAKPARPPGVGDDEPPF